MTREKARVPVYDDLPVPPVRNTGSWTGSGSSCPTMYRVDELRIDPTYAAVTPTPVPGLTLVLAVAGLAVALAARRQGVGRATKTRPDLCPEASNPAGTG